MRVGQRGKFVGHEKYDGFLKGGELFTVKEINSFQKMAYGVLK